MLCQISERQWHISIIQADSEMPKPNPASSPKEISFEVSYLFVFREKIIILLTGEIEGYYNGFIHNVADIL